MISSLSYSPEALSAYINWAYFFRAWGMPPRFSSVAEVHDCLACRQAWAAAFGEADKPQAEAALRLYDDAKRLSVSWEGKYQVHARFGLFDAWSEGDDVVLCSDGEAVRFPFLRQQSSAEDEPCLCWADFIAPQGKDGTHRVGIFAACVEQTLETLYLEDDYRRLLTQTLCDRLAEAAAEKMHEEVRRDHWGYAAEERLTAKELFAEQYVGRRPAVGYPSLPDQSAVFLIDRLIHLSDIGIRLTENGMMQPHAAVCGLMFSHPAARHFAIGRIDRAQLADYAARRGVSEAEMRKYLAKNVEN